ncbi:MAG TPA: MotA/TolQ/ExbB proton channel family protein [Kiritimatiellia bacterium]|nr:MotA/TolQ/ExbB proton channel family protein [Kiritimatiellia bacterium]HMP34069.1 MotA/TolQ/ExbB proton channel family protein [Kiritimatiellia bacterium]
MKTTRLLPLAAALLLAVASLAIAQPAAPEPAAPVAAAAPATPAAGQQLTFGGMLKAGGWTMWPLGLCSLFGIGLAIYNALVIRPSKMLKPEIIDQIKTAVADLDIERARMLCVSNPAPVTNIVQAGLDRIKSGELHISSIEKGMEEYSLQEVATHLQPINYLSVIATISPMIGLLGTVSGMIKAFQAMALGGMGKPELLADNISEALITTATGLIIGIPVMVAYFYFRNRFTAIVAGMNRACGDILESLHAASRGVAEE